MSDGTFPPYPAQDIERFWRHVEQTDGCWLYHGSHKSGSHPYGRYWAQGRMHGAHRFSYEITHGPIPPGMAVCHSCDNPQCVRPTHLWVGSHRDNTQDMMRKGRRPMGEALPHAKLTDEQVAELRRRYHRPSYRVSNINQLADEYGISRAHAKRIVSGGRR